MPQQAKRYDPEASLTALRVSRVHGTAGGYDPEASLLSLRGEQAQEPLAPSSPPLPSLDYHPNLASRIAREGSLALAGGLLPGGEQISLPSLSELGTLLRHPVSALQESSQAIQEGLEQAHEQQLAQAKAAAEKGQVGTSMLHSVAAGIPMFGPPAAVAGETIRHGIETDSPEEVAHGIGQGAAVVAPLVAGTKMGQKVVSGAVEKVGGAAEKAITVPAKAAGKIVQSVTRGIGTRASAIKTAISPQPAKALTQALQPSVTIPRFDESVDIAGPQLQRVAQAAGMEVKNVDAVLDVAKETKAALWQDYEGRGVSGALADTSGIADRIQASVPKRTRLLDPGVADELDARADIYRGKKFSLGQIEQLIQDANEELKGYYKSSGADPRRLTPGGMATKAEVEGLRGLLDKRVEELTGEGTAEFKRTYGAVRDVERAAARQKIVQSRQKPATLYEGLAALSAAGDVVRGNIAGAIAKVTIGQKLRQIRDPNWLVEQAFHGKNAFQPAAAPAQPGPLPLLGRPQLVGPQQRALPPGPRLTVPPPPPDESYVRGIPATPEMVTSRQLPPATTVIPPIPETSAVQGIPAKPTIVRDPRTGRMRRVYVSGP